METLPIYKQIYNDLLEKIKSGTIKSGEKLPSEMELCRTYHVSRITSKRALDLLTEQGYIIRFPGKGSFINDLLNRGNPVSSKTIGLVIPDFSDSFGTKLIFGIEETCSALGYRLVLKRTRDQATEEEAAINSLSDAAGILLLPIHGEFYNSEILKLILNKRPMVFVDRRLRGLAAPAVTTNNSEAAEEGTRYLLELGHRNIAFFSGPITHTSSIEDRRQGFLRAFAKFKLGHNPLYICQNLSSPWTWPFYSPEEILQDMNIVANHLKTYPEISAAFVAEYFMACIVKTEAENLGKRIPRDFSIVTFDAPQGNLNDFLFTHLLQDEYSMGKKAVETLHQFIMDSSSIQAGDILIPAHLIRGVSAGPENRRQTKKIR